MEALSSNGFGKDKGLFVGVDVTKEDEVKNVMDTAESAFGSNVNTVVNCAGIAIASRVLSKKGAHDLSAFMKVLEVNTGGSFNILRLAAERMNASKHPDGYLNQYNEKGVIINTASVAAFDGQIGQVAYAASKGAIAAMTLPIARDLARSNIRIVTIAPGLFLTPMLEGLPEKVQTELGQTVPYPARLGDPIEYAKLCCSIVENGMLNGETIRLDGALRMQP